MRRRQFISLLGGAATLPLAAHAQPAMPVIRFLNPTSPDMLADRLRAFRQGLGETGFVEGKNVAIEYRWAEGQYNRLPTLATELVRRQVAVIVATGGTVTPLAAKAATTSIPIVFIVPGDPVKLGLVASLAQPDGNLTGINIFNLELTAKRLELLRQLVPGATSVAVLVNPANASTENTLTDVEAAARTMGLQIQVRNASTNLEINAVFAGFGRERPDALFVGGDPFFGSRRVQFATLTAHYSIPTAYTSREYVEAGGLMSYGASFTDSFRQAGTCVGRILKGAKPADLPVTQPTKFELVINAEIARMLGLTVPPTLLATADEVIE